MKCTENITCCIDITTDSIYNYNYLYINMTDFTLHERQPSHNDGKSERVVSRKNEDGSFYFALNHNEITSIKDKKHKTTT